jgi:hypothetical protein
MPNLQKNKTFFYFAIGIFFVTIWLPILQMNFKFIKPIRVSNIKKTPTPLPITFENFISFNFQKSLELWFQRKHGFWGYLVRADNHLNLFVFNQISSNYKAALKVAKDKWLFQGLYLNNFNRQIEVPEEKLITTSQKLKKLQELLNSHNIGFSILISTNSIEAHPEIVPWQYYDKTRDQRKSTYQRMLPILNSLGVNIIDAQKILTESSDGDPKKYFTPSGSHWNDVGACRISAEISSKMSTIPNKQTTEIICSPISYRLIPKDQDLDLIAMANLLNKKFYLQATPYTKSSKIIPNNVFRPKVLFVGTSFIWSILNYLEKHKVYSASDFWYYYNRVRKYPISKQRPLDRTKIDWNGSFLNYNFVILEINIALIENIGFEFLDDAILNLEK